MRLFRPSTVAFVQRQRVQHHRDDFQRIHDKVLGELILYCNAYTTYVDVRNSHWNKQGDESSSEEHGSSDTPNPEGNKKEESTTNPVTGEVNSSSKKAKRERRK